MSEQDKKEKVTRRQLVKSILQKGTLLSIGAGVHCDGQLLIVSDMIGQFQAFTPKFVKKYCNVAEVVTNAMAHYCEEVRQRKFPADEHCYRMIKGEDDKFLKMMEK